METLTPRQQKWMATVRANFEAKTGKSMAEWVKIAKGCPETAYRKRQQWLKSEHGLGSNHAAFVLSEAFPSETHIGEDPASLRAALWKDAGSLKILEAIEAAVSGFDGLVSGQRKAFTGFSREFQFAAARPMKAGGLLLGLRLDPSASPRLAPSVRKESWAEKLVSVVEITDARQVDAELRGLLKQAYDRG
ncbi:MAG: DUF4287 domain-containing protein [Caulobacteraceae bacterium]|nr:DUF4287 domain-containing protein [Caulobacteraceae bacterium]